MQFICRNLNLNQVNNVLREQLGQLNAQIQQLQSDNQKYAAEITDLKEELDQRDAEEFVSQMIHY